MNENKIYERMFGDVILIVDNYDKEVIYNNMILFENKIKNGKFKDMDELRSFSNIILSGINQLRKRKYKLSIEFSLTDDEFYYDMPEINYYELDD